MTERLQKLNKVIDYCRSKGKEKEVFDRGTGTLKIVCSDTYQDVCQLENKVDRIVATQVIEDYDKLQDLISDLKLSDLEKQRYENLKKNNQDIDYTLNFELLSDRYAFLSKRLDILSTDIKIQYEIMELSDERLKLLEMIYNKLEKETGYSVPYLPKVVNFLSCGFGNVKYAKMLSEFESDPKNLDRITNEDVETLLLLSQNKRITFNVQSVEDIKRFREEGKVFTGLKEVIQNKVDEVLKNPHMDIKAFKDDLLFYLYGKRLDVATSLVESFNIDGIKVDETNRDLIEIYTAIKNIVVENNIIVLANVMKEAIPYLNVRHNFLYSNVLDVELKKVFAREYNRVAYKPDSPMSKNEDGVSIIRPGSDFKMIITSIGAYQGELNVENYKDYWNNASIKDHCNCCSLISDENLSTAKIKNVIFGFSQFNENMLMLSGEKDLNTYDCSKNMVIDIPRKTKFYSPDRLIDETRSDYNEIDYERRDLSDDKKMYKKQPDYILFIEEYEDNNFWLNGAKDQEEYNYISDQIAKQEKIYKNSVQAAKEFNIPLVIINRESCAKKNKAEIRGYMQDFLETKNPELISKIVTKIFNTRISMGKMFHKPLQEEYFSSNVINTALANIEKVIRAEKNTEHREKLIKKYKEIIELESNKEHYCWVDRNRMQNSGVSFDEIKEQICILERGDL